MSAPVITAANVDVWHVPPHRAITDAVQEMEAVEVVAVEVTTEDATGTGFTYTLGRGGPAIAQLLRDEVIPRLVGRDPLRFEEIGHDLWWALHWVGRTGVSQLAVSAVDIALWDLAGRLYGVPVWKLLGGARTHIPAYHTDCGWLHHSTDALVRESAAAVEAGFAGVKIKVGRRSVEEDLARLRAVRAAIGDDVRLMIDANHAFSPAEAIRRGQRFEEVNPYWFEEPIRADNIDGHVRLKEAVNIPIAVGESLYSIYDFRNYLAAGAADVLQPDVGRVGGFTAWRKVAAMAEAWDVPVVPHYLMELHVHAAAATPAGLFVEYIPAFERILTEPLTIKDGVAEVPTRPGTGVEFDPAAVRRLARTSD